MTKIEREARKVAEALNGWVPVRARDFPPLTKVFCQQITDRGQWCPFRGVIRRRNSTLTQLDAILCETHRHLATEVSE
jgi:hypothetical protein